MIRDFLQQMDEGWRKLGRRMPMEAFVLKHGTDFVGTKRPKGIKAGEPKMCFKNAAHRAFHLDEEYYEGYALNTDMPIIPIHHAWTVKDGKVIDVTLRNPEKYEYIGVRFPVKILTQQLVKHQVYGLLCPFEFVNVALMDEMDPGFMETV